MSYIYKGLDGDKLKILDDSDSALECFDYFDILVLMLDGIKIEGLSLKRNKVYSDDICLEPKKAKNKNLTKAKKAKNDEFYTQLTDIEKELSHYPIETFKDKVIYCPMDVATNTGAILQSQFVKYFQMNAHRLQFKRLIATCLVEKATGDGVSQDEAQNCYILERKVVPMSQRYIHSYMNGEGKTNPVVSEIDDFGLKYVREDNSQHPVPYHIVNQAVTEPDGKITIIARYIDHYDECTGKPILCDTYKGINWVFSGHSLKIKWCRKHPNGELEILPDECYFFNNNVFSDFSIFPKDENNNPCYEVVEDGTVCLYPAEYYDYQELEYDDYEEYFAHCPEDSSEFGGSGDFRSDYCTRLLRECDIVVTNPMFSLFRDFINWIVKADKKFLVIGNINAVSTNDIFKLIKVGLIDIGFESPTEFRTPDNSISKVPCKWFNNLETSKVKEPLCLIRKLEDNRYFNCGNYDAIYVPKVADIPCDYDGKMVVPSTFICSYNSNQFELIGLVSKESLEDCPKLGEEYIENYRAQGGTGHQTANEHNIWYVDSAGKYKRPYTPVVIRHRKDENGRLV